MVRNAADCGYVRHYFFLLTFLNCSVIEIYTTIQRIVIAPDKFKVITAALLFVKPSHRTGCRDDLDAIDITVALFIAT